MTRIDVLKKNYSRVCGMPWDRNVAGPQRVWVAVYDKEDERKLRLRVRLFEEATVHGGSSVRRVGCRHEDDPAERVAERPWLRRTPSDRAVAKGRLSRREVEFRTSCSHDLMSLYENYK